MTSQENKEKEYSENETSKNDLQSKLTQWSKIRERISERLKEFDLLKSAAENAIDSKQEEIGEFVDRINNDIKEMHDLARDAISAVITSSKAVRKWLNEVHDKALKGGFLLIGGAISVIYIHYFITKGFVFDEEFLTSLIVFPLLVLFYGVMRSFKSKIGDKFDASSEINDARNKTREFLQTKLNLNPVNLEQMKNAIQNVKKVTGKTLNVLRVYVPHADKYYYALERENRQKMFRRTLANSLINYGFRLQDTINKWLQGFSPLTNTESEWLDKASSELSKKLAIPRVFITLICSDYVGDFATSKNAWATIKDNDLLSEFVKLLIRNEIVATEYIDTNCTHFGSIDDLIRKQDSFNLEDFKSTYHQFYFDLAKEKIALLNSLRGYRLELPNRLEEQVRKFVPRNFEKDRRQEEMFGYLSEELGMPIEIIRIIFYEYEAEIVNRVKSWKEINKDKKLNSDFFELLIRKELVNIPTHYRGKIRLLTEYLSVKLRDFEDFTLKTANFELSEEFKLLEEKKKYLLRTLSHNGLNIKQVLREEFRCLLPLNDNEIALSEWLSSRIEVHRNIILLFYYDYIQDDKRKEILRTIKNDAQTEILARTLLENHIILKQETSSENIQSEIDNLCLLLDVQEDFDRRLIQSLFDKCNKLFDYAKSVFEFLKAEKMIENVEIEFEPILELVNIRRAEDILSLITEIIKDCLNQNSPEKFTEEWLESITQAVLVLFLEKENDVLQYEACRKAATKNDSVKILYQKILIHENDVRDAKPLTSLSEIVKGVVTGEYHDYDQIIAFQNKLRQGILFPKISLLVEIVIRNIHDIVSERQEKFESMFRRITTQLEVFLNSQLDYDVVLKSLKMNLVNAYMITSPTSRVKVFGKIIAEYLPTVCSEFAETDNDYQDFLMLSEGITGGKGTRLGIIPLRTSFNKFNIQFDKAFKEAVKRYVATYNEKRIVEEEYAANLIRIMPSEAFFKRVVGGKRWEDRDAEDHPVNTIRKLVIEKYPPVKNLELVASLKGREEATINMKNLLTDLLNTRSRIFLFVEEEIRPIVGETKLFNKMKSGEFDNQLIREFEFGALSDLCVFVYKAHSKGGPHFDHILNKITMFVRNLQRRHRKKITEDQTKMLVDIVVIVLESWGSIIEGFSREMSEVQ